jgi:hypothetical protein
VLALWALAGVAISLLFVGRTNRILRLSEPD